MVPEKWWEQLQDWALRQLAEAKQAKPAMGIALAVGLTVGWVAARQFDANKMELMALQRDTALAGATFVVQQTAPTPYRSYFIASMSFAALAAICLLVLVRQRRGRSRPLLEETIAAAAPSGGLVLMKPSDLPDEDKLTAEEIKILRDELHLGALPLGQALRESGRKQNQRLTDLQRLLKQQEEQEDAATVLDADALLHLMSTPPINVAISLVDNKGGTPGVHIKATNRSGEALEQVKIILTNLLLWNEDLGDFTKTREVYNGGTVFNEVQIGNATLYPAQTEGVCLIFHELHQLKIHGQGLDYAMRTAGIWQIRLRVLAADGRQQEAAVCVKWDGQEGRSSVFLPCECPKRRARLG
jgi:hypothetical protein